MTAVDAKVFLRLGSHAEKEYVEKTGHFFDGLIVGANLMEAAPGATASLLFKLGGTKDGRPVFIDPMTYAFGGYADPGSGRARYDLDWIKSERQVKGPQGEKRRDFKRSYRKLADALAGPFQNAINSGSAVSPDVFKDQEVLMAACDSVAKYQMNRIRSEFEKDREYIGGNADALPSPRCIFAPYFYIPPDDWQRWLTLAITLASKTTALAGSDTPVHAVICADVGALENENILGRLLEGLPETGVRGVWLWFSGFNELTARREVLLRFRRLVESLSTSGLEVYNMHGGFFSLCLSKFGLAGISHGIGYGEQKDVMPVVGQGIPTVRYYLPALRRKLGVPPVERCFPGLKVRSVQDFYEQICDCAVCKGVVNKRLEDFRQFGEMHRSSPEAARDAQTPAAAKRCRFHFLLNRIDERKLVVRSGVEELTKDMRSARAKWANLDLLRDELGHLDRWLSVLSDVTPTQ